MDRDTKEQLTVFAVGCGIAAIAIAGLILTVQCIDIVADVVRLYWGV